MPSRNRRADHNIRTLRDRHECLSFCICYNTNHGFFFQHSFKRESCGDRPSFLGRSCSMLLDFRTRPYFTNWHVGCCQGFGYIEFVCVSFPDSCSQEALLKPYTLDAEASWAVCSIFNNGSDLLYSRLNRSHSFKWTIAFTSATNKIDETPSLLTLG